MLTLYTIVKCYVRLLYHLMRAVDPLLTSSAKAEPFVAAIATMGWFMPDVWPCDDVILGLQ